MKSLNIFSKLCSPLVGSQSSDVGFDCRLTVGSPSGFGSKSLLKLVSVLALIFTLGVGNARGTVNNGDLFERISAAPANGDEVLIINQSGNRALSTTQNGNNRGAATISTSSDQYVYVSTDNAQVLTIKKDGSNYGFHTGSGFLTKPNSNQNYLRTGSEAYSASLTNYTKWTLAVSSYVFTITSVGKNTYYIAYNSNNNIFSTYSSGQSKPYIYKKVMSAPTAVAASSVTSSGATITITDATNVNNYELYYSTSSTPPTAGSSATTTITDGKSKALTGLTASTTYYVWARAFSTSPARKTGWVALTGSTFTTSAGAVCGVPSVLTKGSINASSQTVSWTAPASAPANGYLVAYSTATDQNPADNVYSTSGNYTVISVSAGTTTANIPCNAAGTYNWWVRSKCSADNSSLSGWVKGTAFTMKQIYLQVNDNWAGDNANFAAYYWNADPKTGFTKIMTEQTDCEDKIYTCVFPTDYSNMKFVRLDPIQVDPVVNFDNRWNETGNLTLAADKNYYQITGGTGSSVTGSWTTYAQKVKVLFSKNTSADGVTNPDYQCVVKSSGKATAPTISDMSHDYLGYQLNGWWTAADGGTQINFSTQTFTANETTLHAHWTAGSTTKIALKTTWSDQDWRSGNCIVYAHCYIDKTNQFEDILMTGNVCDEYLVADAPYGTTHVSFARCKAGTSLPLGDWASNSNVNNYVAGMTIGGTNTYEITGWGDYGQKVGTATKAGSAYVAPTYTVSFANGGGSGTMTSHTGIACNTSQTLKQNTFEKDYYHFSAWHANVATKVGGETVDAGDDIADKATLQNITGNIALTAQWAPNDYSITATLTNVTPNSAFPSSFTYTGSSTTALNRTLSAATGYNLPENITVTMGGSTLTKGTHYTYNSSTGAFAFTTTITGAIGITVTGVAKTYSNTLDREGAGSGSETVTTTYNSNTLTGYTAPLKTGYTFGGYWSADNGTGTEVIGTNGALKPSVTISTVPWTNSSSQWVKDGTVTMYAKWTANPYTVNFNNGSGTGGESSRSVTYDANTNLTTDVTVPTYAGHDFRGYYTAADGGGKKVINGNGEWIKETSYVDASGNWVNAGSVTLIAYYTAYTYENYRTSCADQYNIVLDDGLVATTNNGSAKVADKGTKLTSIVAPTKSGYDVEGYYTTSGLTTKIATVDGDLQNGSGSGITVGGNAWTNSSSQWVLEAGETFYTKWTAHEYDITYEGLEGASNTNPAKYTIETATIVLANPGSRTGYTFSGWTLGGSPITQITVGSTGDKTITANWTLNQHAVTVSAADHVVITATPASEAAIAEGANRNVNYNKTVTLNCTPDDHWNLVWDVYKTGETATKVAVTGSGDGATFTMPDYAVTVTAVMTEDTYHTATFKNNGAVIDGYDEVKTYDGTRPSAPTLTDVTDACDKTDCNKFYGWIAEDGIWDETIDDVSAKTIYRTAGDLPNVSGADVVYHAVWAKGTGSPNIPNTLIAKWDKQSIAASTAIKATDKDGNTLNTVTLTSNISMSTDGVYCKAADISTDPVITLAGLDFSDYDAGVITFFARGSQQAIITVDYSTDNGSSYSTDHFTDGTAKKEHGFAVTVPNTTTNVKISYGSNTGNFYFGSVRAYGTQTTSYDFTELTSSNTSGWSGADWDGYYLIVGNSSTKALRSDIMEGLDGLTTVSASEGVISTSNLGLIFKATYNSSTSKYAVRSAATQDYLTDAAGGASETFHLLKTSAAEVVSIAYNDILNATGYYVRWNSDRFGSYSGCTAPTLYKIMGSYTEFRVTCCATKVTLSENSPEHGTIAFGKTTVPTCGEDKEVSLTITPAAGYQLHSYEVATGSGKVATKSVSPAISLDNNSSAAQNITLTFAEDANGAYDVTAAFSLMTVTSWTWTMHDGGGAIPDPLNLYIGQSARLDVAYTPSTVVAGKKTYTRDKDNTYINWVGGLQSGYSTISGRTSTGENTTEVTFTHADGPTKTVNVKVLPLPLTHFEDLVHGKAFADVAATIVDNALSATKSTPTSDDWVTPNANDCESGHLHLVGWIREDWPALVAYLNGTGDAPSTTAIVGAGNDGAGHAYYIAAGASINVQTFDGVTFYAVWSKVE